MKYRPVFRPQLCWSVHQVWDYGQVGGLTNQTFDTLDPGGIHTTVKSNHSDVRPLDPGGIHTTVKSNHSYVRPLVDPGGIHTTVKSNHSYVTL